MYEYGPFGQTLRATGPMAFESPWRFSTKRADDALDFVLYEYRAYSSVWGRWLSRDPIEELGGLSLYGFLDNHVLDWVDLFGLAPKPPKAIPMHQLGCCDAATIAAGEKILNDRFNQAKAAAAKLGLKPVPTNTPGASCKNSSIDIIDWLFPTPRCWRCYLQEHNKYSPSEDPNDTLLDHQVIICTAYQKDGTKLKEILFDWWGDEKYKRGQPGQPPPLSGGPPDPIRIKYPYPKDPIDNPFYTPCNGSPPSNCPKPGFDACTAPIQK